MNVEKLFLRSDNKKINVRITNHVYHVADAKYKILYDMEKNILLLCQMFFF